MKLTVIGTGRLPCSALWIFSEAFSSLKILCAMMSEANQQMRSVPGLLHERGNCEGGCKGQ